MIATTIISSISVKPFCTCFISASPDSKLYYVLTPEASACTEAMQLLGQLSRAGFAALEVTSPTKLLSFFVRH